jgi:peptidyl-prolyl cis-trans isomerase SurA
MKKLSALIAAIWLIAVIPAFAAPSPTPINQVVAIVNDNVITQTQFNDALKKVEARAAHFQGPKPTSAMLRQMVIQQMINRELQIQLAKRVGMKISDASLNKSIAQIAKQNKVSVATLYQKSAKQGFNRQDFRNEIRDEIMIQTVEHGAVAPHVTISPREVDDYLNIMHHSKNANAQYQLLDLLIPLSDEPSSEQIQQAEKVANNVIKQLKQNVPIKTIFKANQSGPYAIQDNNLGWRKLGELPSPFVSTVEKMQVGNSAGPIRAPNGFHILKLLNEKNAALKGTASVQRKEIEQMIYQRKYQEALTNWIAQLRTQAYVKILLPGMSTNES